MEVTSARLPRNERRAQIVRLAGELFAERGYHGASMSELARRAGISKPVIYDLVGDKAACYRASCEVVAADIATTITAAVTALEQPVDQLRAGAIAAFELAARHELAASVLFSGGEFAAEAAWLREQRAALIRGLLTWEAQRLGRAVDALQLDAAAHALGGTFEGLALWWKDHKAVDVRTLADWFVELTLSGLERIGLSSEGD